MPNPVERLFSRLASSDVEGALQYVHEDAVFEAQGPSEVPIYGWFERRDGVSRFLTILSEMFDTQVFEVRKWAVVDDFVFAHGYMQHKLRKNGHVFKSEWALVCQIEGGLIRSYKMFEDTAALQAAYV